MFVFGWNCWCVLQDLDFSTVTRVKRRISDVILIRLFAFYDNNAVSASPSSELQSPMLSKLANSPAVKLLQIGYYPLSIRITLVWVGFTGFLLYQGAFEVAGLFLVLTLPILALAYFNERPD